MAEQRQNVITNGVGLKDCVCVQGQAGGRTGAFYMYNAPKDFLIVFPSMQRGAHRGICRGLAPRVAQTCLMALREALCGSQGYCRCKQGEGTGRKALVVL